MMAFAVLNLLSAIAPTYGILLGTRALTLLTLGEQTIIEAVLDSGVPVRIVQAGQVQIDIEQRIEVTAKGSAFIFDEHQQLIVEQGGITDDQLVTAK